MGVGVERKYVVVDTLTDAVIMSGFFMFYHPVLCILLKLVQQSLLLVDFISVCVCVCVCVCLPVCVLVPRPHATIGLVCDL